MAPAAAPDEDARSVTLREATKAAAPMPRAPDGLRRRPATHRSAPRVNNFRRGPPIRKTKSIDSVASPPEIARVRSFGVALSKRSRKLRRRLRRRYDRAAEAFELLHRAQIEERRFLMAHPTSLWRVLWRGFVFCLLVWRILADARETLQAARCAQDELMQPCVDAALGEATKGAQRDRWFFLVAMLEILFNLRTGSVDSKGHFDMRPWPALKRYMRWQFWLDVVLLPPWWLVVRFYYTAKPVRGVDALNLRMLSWVRRTPAVDAVIRWHRGAGDLNHLLRIPPPAPVKRFLDDFLVPWLLGHGFERWSRVANRLPQLGDLAFEYRVLRRTVYSTLGSAKLVLLVLAARRAHRERLLLVAALRSRAARRIATVLRLNAARRRRSRLPYSELRLTLPDSLGSLPSVESDEGMGNKVRSEMRPESLRSPQWYRRIEASSNKLLEALGSRRRSQSPADLEDEHPESLRF